MEKIIQVGECPFDDQGVLGIWRCADGETLVVMCDECYGIWRSPERVLGSDSVLRADRDKVLPGSNIQIFGGNSDWARRDEIDRAGWGRFIKDVKPWTSEMKELQQLSEIAARGRMAYALVCLEKLAAKFGYTSPEFKGLLDTLWTYTLAKELPSWGERISSRWWRIRNYGLWLATEGVDESQKSSPIHEPPPFQDAPRDVIGLAGLCMLIGGANLYGGHYFEASAPYFEKVLAILDEHKIKPPAIEPFQSNPLSSSREDHGLGFPAPRKFYLERVITVYIRINGVYMIPQGITTQGFPWLTSPFEFLPRKADLPAIWDAIERCFADTRRLVLHPTSWKEHRPWYSHAGIEPGVNDWTWFSLRGTKAMSVAETEEEFEFSMLQLKSKRTETLPFETIPGFERTVHKNAPIEEKIMVLGEILAKVRGDYARKELNELREVTVRGRMAFALACLESLAAKFNYSSTQYQELLALLWSFTDTDHLLKWDQEMNAERWWPVYNYGSWLLSEGRHGSVNYNSPPFEETPKDVVGLLGVSMHIGMDIMYGAIDSEITEGHLEKVVAIMDENKISLPALERFQKNSVTPSRNYDGLGFSAPRVFYMEGAG